MATKKPCPICGESTTYLRRNVVCEECLRLVADGKKLRRMQKRQVGKPIRIPQTSAGLPWFSSHERGRDTWQQQYRDALHEIVIRCSQEASHDREYIEDQLFPRGPNNRGNGRWAEVYLEPGARDEFRQLWEAVIGMIDAAYSNGKDRGCRFVEDLCDGTAKIDDYNKLTLGQHS